MLSYLFRLLEIIFDFIASCIYFISARLKGIKKHANILLIGPTNSGKTTLAHVLRTKFRRDPDPDYLDRDASGPYGTHVDFGGTRFQFIDTGGFAAPPLSWFFPQADGIVFLVDAAQEAQWYRETNGMLREVLGDKQLIGIPVVIIGNKIDHPNAVSTEELIQLMELDEGRLDVVRRERAIEVVMASVVLNQGLRVLLERLSQHVNESAFHNVAQRRKQETGR
ncbi:P-loop containing nucleoside triphosphate hydrolase protein [Aspergillus lucknowensis]|uniref:P-loop containing nucleoside triphosphate hydrolase protein n=1 Tax=Aspergillus lucknowensis TaxID=176173 RepID=A0ABR4LDN0_9EURO